MEKVFLKVTHTPTYTHPHTHTIVKVRYESTDFSGNINKYIILQVIYADFSFP